MHGVGGIGMSQLTLDRLRRMTRHEVSWRVKAAARTAAQRLSVHAHHPAWNRKDLRHVLADGIVDEPLGAAIAGEQWLAVHQSLAASILRRTTRFALDPRAVLDTRLAVLRQWPDAAGRAAGRADTILDGRYDVLGYRDLAWTANGSGVDWHFDPVHNRRAPQVFWADVPYLDPAIGDHKIIWELNRHQHWLQFGRAFWLTGDTRYRRAVVDALETWLAANPPLIGINWASMLEIGFRTMSWVWALHFLLGIRDSGSGIRDPKEASDAQPWLVDMFIGLDRQLNHVEQHLSVYFSPNTHLTGEALALYVAGVALPELASSYRWAETGRRILLAEIDRQIHPDGGHAEHSTHYQRYTLDFYLMALLTAERDHDTEAVSAFRAAVTRLAEFTRTMADDAGRLPLLGDDDGGMLWPIAGRECADVRDSLALAAQVLDRPDLAPWGIQEEVFWITGRTAIDGASPPALAAPGNDSLSSRALVESGYFVARDGSGGHAVFDAGRHGYMNGGHAHADALAVTLSLAGRPLLIDPGTSTYTMDPSLRDRLRSSMSHNTVSIGRRSQGVPSGPFHWHTHVDATLEGWRQSAGFDWVSGSHDGYAPVRHRRTMLRTRDSGWLIVDDLLGEGRVDASAHWHFDPGWMLTCEAPGRLRAAHFEGDEAWLLHDAGDVWLVHGDEESGLGWYAPVYGTLVPTWTARITRDAPAPFSLLTWIGRRHLRANAPSMERIAPSCDAGAGIIGARIVAGGQTSVFLLRPSDLRAPDLGGCGIGDYQTNARVLHYAEQAGRLVALDLVDASHALSLREGWISIAATESMPDLHASINDNVLQLHASHPPPQLRLQGGALRGVLTIRLNHREQLPRPTDRTDTFVIEGGDWGRVNLPQQSAPSCLAT
jgi:hypothetical protein